MLHHLREEREWREVFSKLRRALKPGGSLWIADHIEHAIAPLQNLMMQRWGKYLSDFKGPECCDQVFAYVEQEDTPRPLIFQIDLLRAVGFKEVEVLHKNCLFGAFGAVKV